MIWQKVMYLLLPHNVQVHMSMIWLQSSIVCIKFNSSIAIVEDLRVLLDVKEIGPFVGRVPSSTPVNPSQDIGCLTSVLRNILWMDG